MQEQATHESSSRRRNHLREAGRHSVPCVPTSLHPPGSVHGPKTCASGPVRSGQTCRRGRGRHARLRRTGPARKNRRLRRRRRRWRNRCDGVPKGPRGQTCPRGRGRRVRLLRIHQHHRGGHFRTHRSTERHRTRRCVPGGRATAPSVPTSTPRRRDQSGTLSPLRPRRGRCALAGQFRSRSGRS